MALVIGGEQASELDEQTTVVLRPGPPNIESIANLEVDERTLLFNQLEDFYTFAQTLPDVSPEELRLEDYKLRPDVHMKAGNETVAQCFARSFSDAMRPSHEIRQKTLNLLQGAGIEIVVGNPPDSPDIAADWTVETWTLPKNLISHYSPLCKAACERDFKERQENKICLPEDDPVVFAGFVEWMYYGSNICNSPTAVPVDPSDGIPIHAKRWILGDKFLCTDFKNDAMYHLYNMHVNSARLDRPVTVQDVRFVCDNSAANSKLTRFYFDFVVSYISDTARVSGSIEEWDLLMVEYRDFRLAILGSFRPNSGLLLKHIWHYYD